MNAYYYSLNGRQNGPVSKEQLMALLSSGTLTPASLVWCNGMAGWQPISTVFPSSSGAPARNAAPSHAQARTTGRPSNGMVLAILSTIFGCLPMGIVSIIKSAKVNSLWNRGLYAEANKAASFSKTFSFISIGIGIICNIISFGLMYWLVSNGY